jgi:hypothetical protein
MFYKNRRHISGIPAPVTPPMKDYHIKIIAIFILLNNILA